MMEPYPIPFPTVFAMILIAAIVGTNVISRLDAWLADLLDRLRSESSRSLGDA